MIKFLTRGTLMLIIVSLTPTFAQDVSISAKRKYDRLDKWSSGYLASSGNIIAGGKTSLKYFDEAGIEQWELDLKTKTFQHPLLVDEESQFTYLLDMNSESFGVQGTDNTTFFTVNQISLSGELKSVEINYADGFDQLSRRSRVIYTGVNSTGQYSVVRNYSEGVEEFYLIKISNELVVTKVKLDFSWMVQHVGFKRTYPQVSMESNEMLFAGIVPNEDSVIIGLQSVNLSNLKVSGITKNSISKDRISKKRALEGWQEVGFSSFLSGSNLGNESNYAYRYMNDAYGGSGKLEFGGLHVYNGKILWCLGLKHVMDSQREGVKISRFAGVALFELKQENNEIKELAVRAFEDADESNLLYFQYLFSKGEFGCAFSYSGGSGQVSLVSSISEDEIKMKEDFKRNNSHYAYLALGVGLPEQREVVFKESNSGLWMYERSKSGFDIYNSVQ